MKKFSSKKEIRHAREGGHPELYETIALAALDPRLRGGDGNVWGGL
jgi:hypothetical protein